MFSSPVLGLKAQEHFVSSSCMFLDEKTSLKIWLNLGLNLHTYILLLTLPKKGFSAQYNTIKNTDLSLDYR